jgi:hypothetical protein
LAVFGTCSPGEIFPDNPITQGGLMICTPNKIQRILNRVNEQFAMANPSPLLVYFSTTANDT